MVNIEYCNLFQFATIFIINYFLIFQKHKFINNILIVIKRHKTLKSKKKLGVQGHWTKFNFFTLIILKFMKIKKKEFIDTKFLSCLPLTWVVDFFAKK